MQIQITRLAARDLGRHRGPAAESQDVRTPVFHRAKAGSHPAIAVAARVPRRDQCRVDRPCIEGASTAHQTSAGTRRSSTSRWDVAWRSMRRREGCGWYVEPVSGGISRHSRSVGKQSRSARKHFDRHDCVCPLRMSALPGSPRVSTWSGSVHPRDPNSLPGVTVTSSVGVERSTWLVRCSLPVR